MTYDIGLVLILFGVSWLLTFVPCWLLLAKLIAMSTSERLSPAFWVHFIVYRLLIFIPYAVLLIFGRDSVPSALQAVIVGIVATGLIFSAIRFVLRKEVVTFLWWIYGFSYDGLLRFVPYMRLIDAVVTTAHQAVPSPKTVLELGSGTGNVLRALEEQFPNASLTGVDNSSSMLRIARKKTDRTRHVRADIIDFLENTVDTYDVIVMQNSLYAVSDRSRLWPRLEQLLAATGVVVITNSDTPGSGSIVKEHFAYGGSWFDLLRPRLLLVGLIDNFISQLSRSGTFSFLSAEQIRSEIKGRFEMSEVSRVYGGVNILFVLRHRPEGAT